MSQGTHHYLACDLGAESGRLMLGALTAGTFQLEEIHRFPNQPIRSEAGLQWDTEALWCGLMDGLRLVAGRGITIESISADSWGLDYFLFDQAGRVLPPTHHYRDERTARGVESVLRKLDWETIFAETGIQFMPINTLYQLAAESPSRLAGAASLLGIGDGINYLLSGVARHEISLASTFQLFNPRAGDWSQKLISALSLPKHLFPAVVPSGTRLGPLKPEIARETGVGSMEVVATCSHDTGAAVAAVPVEDPTRNWAYISSGTWSLLGAELTSPRVDELCRQHNFTNEIGYGGSIRLLTNIVGLWLVQECRRTWAAQGGEFSYEELTRLAGQAAPFASLIDPSDPRFLSPGDMPQRVASWCAATGQPIPQEPGAVIRCALESLALLYHTKLRQLEVLNFSKFERIHIVGGGSRNDLLNQFTANACQLPVHAGPVEATALGNIIVQALALGHLPSLEAARKLVHRSSEVRIFLPQQQVEWRQAVQRFQQLIERKPA